MQGQGNWTVIGPQNVGVMLHASDRGKQGVGHQEIIQPPAPVFQAFVQSVGPPGIGAGFFRMERPEHIYIAASQQPFHSLPFIGKKAGRIFFVAEVFGVHIEIAPRHIKVPAEDGRLVQPVQKIQQRLIPCNPVIQPLVRALGVRDIHVDDAEGVIFQRDQPSFTVELVNPKPILNGARFLFSQDQCPGIAALLRQIPVLKVLRGIQRAVRSYLLAAYDVRPETGDGFQKSFALTGGQSVHIPGNQLHGTSLISCIFHLLLS